MKATISLARSRQRVLAAVLVGCWVVAMIGVFWFYQFRDVRVFLEEDLVAFDASSISGLISDPLAVRSEVGLLLHFWDPGCGCTRFSQSHAKEVMEVYSGRGIEFGIVVPGYAWKASAKEHFPLARKVIVVEDLPELSSPSAAVLDAESRLVYLGPYGVGLLCASDGREPVETTLESLLAEQEAAEWLNFSVIGCFCQWPSTMKTT
ncbi:hypothetical protein IC757_10065 [Wenzhouxiangella sp. AB-CW3]|uniref:DUF6436 domain-containing protein n=1 Tax=Wenzhouxiangella sp. AB-CW3 TaxID=2771012 RepID=UPI00168AC04C|nr:DUF6436 domain-containing protein [Wenzhouxiangella sp. AB-CW3]QOC21400.1 hypothetical protein IC757_10065 [Wenzhouxiangella sp. AB-CW3]